MTDIAQLDEIDSPQAALNIASKRLRALKRLGEFCLSQTRFYSALLQQPEQHQVLISIHRLFQRPHLRLDKPRRVYLIYRYLIYRLSG